MADRDSPWLSRSGTPVEDLPDPFAPEVDPHSEDELAPPPRRRRRWLRWALTTFFALLLITILWLVFTAPLGRALEPLPNPAMLIVSADGQAIARRGAIKEAPVEVARLNKYTPGAFVAIEDRRFYSHWGIDPRSIGRALITNLHAGGVRQGGSTITQQLAKTSFLSSDRNLKRKAQEVIIAFWLEAWLTKDEILSRYLSSVYFGDGVYGLRAAAHHYFGRDPENLTLAQSAMLAGMVQAPSRLAPTHNLPAAQKRSRLVLQEMADTGVISLARARAAASARPVIVDAKVPTGTYFADWVAPQAADAFAADFGEIKVKTTLDSRLQRLASRAVANASIGGAQAALVAMRPDGRVVAMVGGNSYKASPFNRATQGRRQPGSTFKLFVYLAALRSGWTPDSKISDTPIKIDGWSPTNSDGVYRGDITLKEAFARSSNAASVRLSESVGRQNVLRAARDLGISTPLPNTPSVALGSAGVSLLELTSAYAAIASGRYPVRASGLPPQPAKEGADESNLSSLFFTQGGRLDRSRDWKPMLDLLWAAANEGTGRRAALSTPTFGKTGTSQDNRDALFVGFAGDLVVGVWVGRDDNTPMAHSMSGGSAPAEIWRAFMAPALAVDGRNATSLPGDYQPPRRLPPPTRKSPLPSDWDVDPSQWVGDLMKDAERLLDRL
ncbi:transglycosylase domain-containing protein [Sphingomonas sp. KRR8]|uniref:transglycosylase domain-containing protein n=1 Tax=Sphingomonas sp. KRR8 TaxID=2942996 RepID=UPI002021D2D0|nr:transglycosylase domain-containing protein [Sphingomonas sp. KRR8]URD60659.1 transglycosylase domain-containing protein [Sphingomonas sp. KRR8]